jgi:tetratricopeptide (TPR) repeat protein
MMLEKDPDQALAQFALAMERGAQNLNALSLQIRLLADRGRLPEARKLMDKIPAQTWSSVLDRTAAEVLLGVGETDKAFAEAEKVAKSKSEDLPTQLWFADMAAKLKKPEAAESALVKATVLSPSDPEVWTRLVGLYIQLKKPEQVEKTLREAHLALDEEYLPLLTGKYYELQSRWQEAEDIYLAAYANRTDEINVARRLAEFYLTWASANEANKGKAAVYLNRILHAANEGKLPKDDPNGAWARRQAARLLAQTQDYQDTLKAERLLADATAGGSATPEDQDLLVDILSSREDPVSRQRAVDELRKIRQQRGLSWSRELQLGHMLSELGDWEGAKRQLEDAIGRFPSEIGLQTALVSMLIQHKEYTEAQTRIARLEDNKAAAAGVAQLKLELAASQGKKDDVRKALASLTPNLRGALKADQIKMVHDVALLAESVGDYEYALATMREYARRVPGSEMELARMTALHGNIDEGFKMLRQLMDKQMDEVLQTAIGVLHARRAEAPAKIDEEVSRIVRQGLRDDPENAKRLMLEAEMLETQGKYAESIEAYKRLMARDDVPKSLRASVANNLAFIVALQDPKPEDLQLALKYVNEAINVMGPMSDILDTRALIYISLGQFADAVTDMQMAVKMNVTPSKWFHLAEAQLGAGDQKGAKATWDRAKQAGLKPDSVAQPEQGKLEQFMKKMESVSLTPQL